MSRSPEIPPPFSGDTQKWAEDVTDYLLRELQRLYVIVDDLEARVEALEP